MLNIEVSRNAEGVERYFGREIGRQRLPDKSARRMGRTRSGVARTPWSGATVPVRRIVAKRGSDEWPSVDGAYEYDPPGKRGNGQQPAGWLWARVRSSQVAQHIPDDHRRSDYGEYGKVGCR